MDNNGEELQFDKENDEVNDTTWEIQLVSDELKGIKKSEYHNNSFWFIKYDWNNNEFTLSDAYDSIYELLCGTADGINLSGNSNVKEWKNYKLLPEIIKQKASKNLIMLLLYLRARFEFLNQDFFDGEEAVPNIPGWYLHQFYTAEDYYEENPYFQAILESFPTAEFVAGWSTVLPEYDEVYAIVAMTEEREN